MELKKLENINEHQGEIYSRPRKEWFLNEREKRQIQDKAREQSGEAMTEPKKLKTKKIFKKGQGQQGRRPNNKR